MSVEIDGYDESNVDYWIQAATDVHPSTIGFSAVGQTFTGKAGYALSSVTVPFGANTGTPIGNLVAVIYAMAGTYGTDGIPTGSPLATSNPVPMESIAGGMITFTFPTPLPLNAQYYCLSIEARNASVLNGTNYPNTGVDSTAPTHPGNMFRYAFGGWTTPLNYDLPFHVYAGTGGGIPGTPINQIVNGDFRQGLTGWFDQAVNGGFISIDNTVSTVPVLKDSPTSYEDRSTWPQQRIPIRADGSQRLLARVWIKTGPSTDNSYGARLGIDFRAGNIMTTAYSSGWVPWGSDWTLREITAQCPAGSDTVIPWLQAMLHDNPATAYFDYVELYLLEVGQQAPPAHAQPPATSTTPPPGQAGATTAFLLVLGGLTVAGFLIGSTRGKKRTQRRR